jgi:very-short-patch-repair endonuclease
LRAGYRVLRITYRRFTEEPDAVLDDIRALAALAAFEAPPRALRR